MRLFIATAFVFLFFLNTEFVWAEGGAQVTRQRGARQDYYRAPQVMTGQTYRGEAQTTWSRTADGRYIANHGFQSQSTYQGEGPQGIIGAGKFHNSVGRTETYRKEEDVQSDAKENARHSSRVTSANKALAKLKETELVVLEESRQQSLPEDMIEDAQVSLFYSGKAAQAFRDLFTNGPVTKQNMPNYDAAKEALNSFESKIAKLPKEKQAGARRIHDLVEKANEDALWASAFGR